MNVDSRILPNLVVAVLLLGLIAIDNGAVVAQDKTQKRVPVKVNLLKETLKRIGRAGDNWCITVSYTHLTLPTIYSV